MLHTRSATKARGGVAVPSVALRMVMFAGVALGSTGCSTLTNDPGLSAGTPDPTIYDSQKGAVGLRNAALLSVDGTIPTYLLDVGLLTDELQDRTTGASAGAVVQNGSLIFDPLDERILPEGGDGGSNGSGDGRSSYSKLQAVRGTANLALAALATYDTTVARRSVQRDLRSELFSMSAYAEILLADLFCAGVPLSTLDFHEDFTYAPSSTSAQVYQDAVVKLDSALSLAPSSDTVLNLARVLKGRALLALGQYTAAATAVAAVPDSFQYRTTIKFENLITIRGGVASREGNNGLPYVSSADPRTATTVLCTAPAYDCPAVSLRFPAKYSVLAYRPFVVANGIEARLVRAEAELQPATAPAGPWLATLNTLRESIGLSDTTDPGTASGRISLLFRERAFWLFMTGHRQGDLRRLLRQYSSYTGFQTAQQVYPSGVYAALGAGQYGGDVTAPIPVTEYANPQYHGCLDRKP